MVTRLKEDFTPFFLLHSERIISIFFLLRIIIRALDQKLPNEVKFRLLTLIHVTFFFSRKSKPSAAISFTLSSALLRFSYGGF